MSDTRVDVRGNTPDQIKSVMLADGKWYTVSNCHLIQYGINNSSSPLHLAKVYPYLEFKDGNSGKWFKVPFSQIIAFETNDR